MYLFNLHRLGRSYIAGFFFRKFRRHETRCSDKTGTDSGMTDALGTAHTTGIRVIRGQNFGSGAAALGFILAKGRVRSRIGGCVNLWLNERTERHARVLR